MPAGICGLLLCLALGIAASAAAAEIRGIVSRPRLRGLESTRLLILGVQGGLERYGDYTAGTLDIEDTRPLFAAGRLRRADTIDDAFGNSEFVPQFSNSEFVIPNFATCS